ncbi:mitochondria-eating protein isoform X2 [Xenopus tropicalis]|uniref:Mitochondria-eating protein n=1 Tax=Xenopus tropicalis TaxID=8364 RepID=A0A8J0QXA8_XENTR|nr:mitochondria-eating protein isoform X2 [Xenopus tropicalis]|eukprot:XP_004912624.1 PREDICTED: mitochondria-eating protein isoform X2 [Xenopus tropicalis]
MAQRPPAAESSILRASLQLYPGTAMADTLRRLANSEKCRVLQDKLDDWYKDYHINSCDSNLNVCCELLELNSKIQGQLFKILSVTAREGGQYAGVETLKSRFLPWLGTCFSASSPGSFSENSCSILNESMERKLSASHERELNEVESKLSSTRIELNSVRQELLETQMDLEDTKNKSANTLLATEEEILQLRAEVSRSRSPSPIRHSSRSSSPFPRSESPTCAKITNASRQARLISRFNDIFANDRLDAQTLLRRYIDDLEMVQRIIFIATVESFHAAKMAFRQFRLRVRKSLSPSHMGPESLEDTVIDYIVRNLDLYDVQSSVNEVISAMNVNPKISFPPDVDFILISAFIREVCRVAFAMQTLDPPLDIAFTVDGELFTESKYRRTYDSEHTAPLVYYHVWPALMENDNVIVKGEALTKRGALWSSVRSRSRSTSPVRSRSASPGRNLTSRSRSPSPRRSGTPRF